MLQDVTPRGCSEAESTSSYAVGLRGESFTDGLHLQCSNKSSAGVISCRASASIPHAASEATPPSCHSKVSAVWLESCTLCLLLSDVTHADNPDTASGCMLTSHLLQQGPSSMLGPLQRFTQSSCILLKLCDNQRLHMITAGPLGMHGWGRCSLACCCSASQVPLQPTNRLLLCSSRL